MERSMEKRNSNVHPQGEISYIPLGLKLLLHLKDVYWRTEDIENAIESIRNDEHDLVLDFPLIRSAVETTVAKCLEHGLISRDFYRLAGIQYDV